MATYNLGHGIIAQLIIHILRTVLLKQAAEQLLTRKNPQKGALKAHALKAVYGIYYLSTSTAYYLWNVSIGYEACCFLGLLAIACCYSGTPPKKLWASLTLFCIDLSCTLAAAFAFQKNQLGFPPYLVLAASVLLLLASVAAINHVSGSKGFQQGLFGMEQTWFLPPSASIAILSFLSYAKPENNRIASAICICILAMNLSVFFLYYKTTENYAHLRERDLYKQQTAFYQNQLEIIMESQSRIRSLRHDMKNHILALQAAVKNGNQQETQAYLEKMQEFMVNPTEYVMTGNEDIDSLMNYKIRKATELLHTVKTNIQIPENLNLNSFDLNIILGNLLDNAIEAALQTEEKSLEIEIATDRGIMFFHIQNSSNESPSQKNGNLQTTKSDRQNHGMGIKNAKAILEKYHGDLDILYGPGYFEADAMLYMGEL